MSYNPPPEYLPTEEEKKQWLETEAEERDKDYLPQGYGSLRKVPAYDKFVKERFERCLDLCKCPNMFRPAVPVPASSPCSGQQSVPTLHHQDNQD